MTTVKTQIRALLSKERTILARRRASTAFELGAAPLLLILLGILNAAQKLPLPDSTATSIATLGGATSTPPISCAVFDGLDGQYGYGVRMPGAWCIPIVFAPWTTETAQLMSILADRNGYRPPVRYVGEYQRYSAPQYVLENLDGTTIEPGDGAHPCRISRWGGRNCAEEMATVMLGFRDVPSLKSWLQTTTGRTTTAVVFGDTTSTTSSSAGATGSGLNGGSQGGLITFAGSSQASGSSQANAQLSYELWYNRTAIANGWAAAAGLDALGLSSRADQRGRDNTRLQDSDMLVGSVQMVCAALAPISPPSALASPTMPAIPPYDLNTGRCLPLLWLRSTMPSSRGAPASSQPSWAVAKRRWWPRALPRAWR